MNVFELTRALVDIESITGNEERVGVLSLRCPLPACRARSTASSSAWKWNPRRFNVFARLGRRRSSRSPPTWIPCRRFFASREDDEFIWGRGACDTKGIIASMIIAAEALLDAGERNFGLLFVVGEERNSAGAYHAAKHPRGSRFIINGEPTENKLALGSKGALRYEVVAQRQDGALRVSRTGRIRHRQTARRARSHSRKSRCLSMTCSARAR